MAHAISMDDGETRATPNQRFEALMRRAVPPDYQQELGDDDLHKFMDRDLYKATKEGDVEKFIDALEKVIDSRKLALSLILNQVTPSGDSLLHVAASRFGSDDVMELYNDVMELRVVDMKRYDDVMELSDDVMELILNHFPHIMTPKNSSDDTPLHVAVQNRRFGTTEKLIHRETNSEIIYWKNEDGKSPLYLAVENCVDRGWKGYALEEQKIVKLLLEESARDEAYAVKIQGISPVLATFGWLVGNIDLLKEIIDRLPKLLHVRDEDGGTSLHAATSVGDFQAIDLLLEKCPYLALQTDKNGSYPIHIACEAGYPRIIIPLLEDTWLDLAGIKNKKRQNILHVAAKGGNIWAVDHIIEKYSETDTIEKLVNAKDVDGNTPLHLASMHNHCSVMRSMTKVKRIDLKLRNNDGLTALDVAMESRSLSTEHPALVGRAILIVAGVPRSESREALLRGEQGSGASKSSPAEWIKDQVNTLLLVATLVASVTFTAGLTLPGGYNASGDPHPGTATMLHHIMFRVFIITNMLAMYSSILAVVVLLWGLNRDFYVAELAYHSAGPLLLMALTSMSVAFFAAISVAVGRLAWLGSLVMSVGVLYLAMVVVVLAALIFPSSKTTMFIVIFYYIAIYRARRIVKVCARVCASVFHGIVFEVPALLFTFCFQTVVRICKCIFRLRESS